MIAPLWLLTEGYLVYGLTSLFHTVQLETLTYTTSELREDLIASIHAVLLAPVLEELCFRQMAISPFRRRGAQVAVCVVMAVLFGILHVRNSPGAFFAAMVYGLVFIWSRNIWCGITLHAGADRGQFLSGPSPRQCNLTEPVPCQAARRTRNARGHEALGKDAEGRLCGRALPTIALADAGCSVGRCDG